MNRFGGTVTIARDGRMLEPEAYAPFLAMDEVAEVEHKRYYFDIYQNAIAIDGKPCDVEAPAADEAKWAKIPKARLHNVMQTELNIGQRGKKLTGPDLHVIGIDPSCDTAVNAETMSKHLVEGGRFPEADDAVALNYYDLDPVGFTDVEPGSTLTLGDYSKDYTVVGFVGKIDQPDMSFAHARAQDGRDISREGNRPVEIYGEASAVLRLYVAAVVAVASAVILIMAAPAMHERRYEIDALMPALAVGLALPASAISSLAILRYRPMAILRSRTQM